MTEGPPAITLTPADREAFANALEAVEADVARGDLEVRMARRGRRAGEVPYGEVVRVLSDAYTGRLHLGGRL